jgi:hypothetical protein
MDFIRENREISEAEAGCTGLFLIKKPPKETE